MNSLRKLTYEPSQHDLDALFAKGRLMSPAEVADATRHRADPEVERYAQRWMACGDVKTTTYELFSRPPNGGIPLRVSAFSSTLGSHWGVITHQLEGHQHRFMLPLGEPASAAFFRAMSTARYGFSLGRAGGMEAVVIPGQPLGEDIRPLLQLCDSASRQSSAVCLQDLPQVVLTLARPGAIPSFIHGCEVTDVSVSITLPGPLAAPTTAWKTVH